jgi:hypothetical protein
MSNIILKYNLLDEIGQQEVQDFIDFLLSKRAKKEQPKKKAQKVEPENEVQQEETFMEKYRKNLLEISVWTEEEVAVFDENRKLFNKWTVEEL